MGNNIAHKSVFLKLVYREPLYFYILKSFFAVSSSVFCPLQLPSHRSPVLHWVHCSFWSHLPLQLCHVFGDHLLHYQTAGKDVSINREQGAPAWSKETTGHHYQSCSSLWTWMGNWIGGYAKSKSVLPSLQFSDHLHPVELIPRTLPLCCLWSEADQSEIDLAEMAVYSLRTI